MSAHWVYEKLGDEFAGLNRKALYESVYMIKTGCRVDFSKEWFAYLYSA